MTKILASVVEELGTWDATISTLKKDLAAVKERKDKPRPALAKRPQETKTFKGALFTGKRDSPEVEEFLQQVRLFVIMNGYSDVQHQRMLLSEL